MAPGTSTQVMVKVLVPNDSVGAAGVTGAETNDSSGVCTDEPALFRASIAI